VTFVEFFFCGEQQSPVIDSELEAASIASEYIDIFILDFRLERGRSAHNLTRSTVSFLGLLVT